MTRHIAHGAWCFIYDELVVEIAKILAAKRLGCSLIIPWDDTGYLVKKYIYIYVPHVVVQSLSHVQLFATHGLQHTL